MRGRCGVLVLVGLAVMTVLSQGCAVVPQGETVCITTEPAGVVFTIYNARGEAIDNGITPATVVLKGRGSGHFSPPKYTVQLAKKGFADCEARIKVGTSRWYSVASLLFVPIEYLIGCPVTGPVWTLKDLHVDMEGGPRGETTDGNREHVQIATELMARPVRASPLTNR